MYIYSLASFISKCFSLEEVISQSSWKKKWLEVALFSVHLESRELKFKITGSLFSLQRHGLQR